VTSAGVVGFDNVALVDMLAQQIDGKIFGKWYKSPAGNAVAPVNTGVLRQKLFSYQ
jgi:hypothetical protein